MKPSTTALLFACIVLAGCSQLASPVHEQTTPTPEPESTMVPPQPTSETRTPTTAETGIQTATATPISTATQTATATATPTVTAMLTVTEISMRTPERPPTATATPIPTPTTMRTVAPTQTVSPTPEAARLTIEEIDAENETIEFRNTGEMPLNLDGYVVDFDGYGQQYTFPAYTLSPNETVTLHTGRGDSAGAELYAGFFYPVINDDGDTILVENPRGKIVLARRV
ncbi:MAG TPA: lamin tail domain-containing protein [Halococcus sp.]|nr:lamin tail domain-containing protein [Halococcus sp.]